MEGTDKIDCAFSIKSPFKSIKEICTLLQLTLFCCSLLMTTFFHVYRWLNGCFKRPNLHI